MSLLLDALKKAANEKEKLKSAQDGEAEEVVTAFNEAEESEDMDLDLDISMGEEVYPEIDEDVVIPAEQPESMLESDESLIIGDELEKFKAEKSSEVLDEDIEPEVTGPEVIIGAELESLSSEDKEVEPDLPEEETEIKQPETFKPAIQPAIKKEHGIKNKEALSELINKSNKYSTRKKMKTRFIIASSISLVFLLTAAYLYFEFSTGSQNIYVANGGSQPVKSIASRNSKPLRTPPVIEDNVKAIQPKSKKMVAHEKVPEAKQNVKRVVEKPPVKKPSIKIVHKTVKDPTEDLVRQAYDAFNRQDYETSERLYKKVNVEEPKNRDALLGLAAIGIKQQRYEYARQKYLQLRYLNPKDSIATAGLSSIQDKIKPEQNESELKLMSSEQPEAAHLYFALGSLYAGQKKWADAQASFFSAWSADNTNSDYAFNLAVSLDQLGKKAQAKQLYELSLKLNQVNKGSFSIEIVEKRIKTLNENSD